MECDCGQEADQGTEVSLGAPGDGTWARLWNRVDPWGDDSIQVCVQIGAPGLLAAVHQVTLTVMGESDLVWFFDDLAGNFTGWDGARVWESMDHDLRVEAVFASRGYVSLTWTVTPWRQKDGNWTASTTVVLEAGEQMLQLARNLNRFLGPPAPGELSPGTTR
ncbi:DUF6228 family protein [Nocardia sp. NBC_00565]|uniref:DUF6228 family protein n=1 Tax=Nocardia sp. NBC_00565 TaxID=2975993 RepID=UPI002E81D814|nr:DUF6228 family protein [Nocardia sp. NBC_00565]WUC06737.1 DUF6228 family protein [Nocardia sp. NBC_00565]